MFAQFSAWLVASARPDTVESFTRATRDAFREYIETRRPLGAGRGFNRERMAPETVQCHLRRLKTFCGCLTAAGYFSVNFCLAQYSDLPLLPAIPAEARIVKLVTAGELQHLINHLQAATTRWPPHARCRAAGRASHHRRRLEVAA